FLVQRTAVLSADAAAENPEPPLAPPLAAREDPIQVVQIVDHAPLRSAGLLNARLPFLEAPEVAAWIDVVGLELDDVDRDHADVLEADREAAHRHLVELLLHVGEDDDGLRSSAAFIQEFRALDQGAGDVGIAAAGD